MLPALEWLRFGYLRVKQRKRVPGPSRCFRQGLVLVGGIRPAGAALWIA
jgi:hypothetical protein